MKLRSFWERWYPLLLGITFFICYFFWVRNHSLPEQSKLTNLFSAGTTLSSITIGFLITAESILLSIDERYIVKKLKETKTYNKLVNYFMSAIQFSFGFVLMSIFCLFIDFDTNNHNLFHKLLFTSWLSFLILTSSSCYRVIAVFSDILKS
jgi:hypothetical protein